MTSAGFGSSAGSELPIQLVQSVYMTELQLLERLGIEVFNGLPAVGESAKDRIERARVFLTAQQKLLRDLLCGHPKLAAFRSNGSDAERLALAAAVFDLILGAFGMLPAVTIAALLARVGLDSLCSGQAPVP